MAERTGLDSAALAGQWEQWAREGRQRGRQLSRHGDMFDAELKFGRAFVRELAAQLLRHATTPQAAAEEMMRQATLLWQREPAALADWDQAAIDYTQARSWQYCAWCIDPTLPEVQPLWT